MARLVRLEKFPLPRQVLHLIYFDTVYLGKRTARHSPPGPPGCSPPRVRLGLHALRKIERESERERERERGRESARASERARKREKSVCERRVRPHFGRLGLLRRARPDPEACPAVPRRAHEHRGIHALQKIDRESQRERVRERARERESERESERERRVRAREKSAAPLRKAVPPLGTGLGFKAHRLVYHSTLGWRVIKKDGAAPRGRRPQTWWGCGNTEETRKDRATPSPSPPSPPPSPASTGVPRSKETANPPRTATEP